MLGARSVEDVIAHAGAFVDALAGVTGTVVDLGSGGGVPGLVIARARPDLRLLLVDRRSSRTDHLRRLVARLGMAAQVETMNADATSPPASLIGIADAVVARGFAAPSVTLVAAAPLLRTHGLLIVSEPPQTDDRWPQPLLEQTGLTRIPYRDRRVAVFRRRDDSRET